MSEKSDMYEFKVAVFENGKQEEFLLFVHNFMITLDAPGTLVANTKIQYLCTLINGEYLYQFDALCSQVGSTTMAYLNGVIWV